MNNKRTLVIAVVAFLAVILSVTASFVFARSAESAQPIPVNGHIDNGASPDNQIALPRLAPSHIDYGASPDNLMALPQLAPGHIDYGAPPVN
jgi:hypothetical protein